MDILCLQEVFFADTQRLIYRALKNKYPYAVSALNLSLDEESPQRACTVQEAILFQTCIATQCPGLTGNLLGNCFLMRYVPELLELRNCVASLEDKLLVKELTSLVNLTRP